MVAADHLNPLLVILGETASGKSELAVRLALHFDGEIICADSWTVRKDMNIGTAKPSAEQQQLIPHHLLDIVYPDEDFTAAVYKRLALIKIDEIARRGKLPILVGGTGLYIDGVIYNFGFLPATDPSMRTKLNILSNQQLIHMIMGLDISLDNIDLRNKRRLIRLIETNGARPTKDDLRLNTVLIGISTSQDDLNQRIADRVDSMIYNGLEAEVKALVDLYGWECEGLKGVGYAQWRDYFLQNQNLLETRQKIIKATLELAKKQRTWFRRNKSIHWYQQPVILEDVVDIVTTLLYK